MCQRIIILPVKSVKVKITISRVNFPKSTIPFLSQRFYIIYWIVFSSKLILESIEDCKNSDTIINTKKLYIEIFNKKILIDTELVIKNGTKYGLIGKNGNGKTTIINGILNNNIKSTIKPLGILQTLLNNNNDVFTEIIPDIMSII